MIRHTAARGLVCPATFSAADCTAAGCAERGYRRKLRKVQGELDGDFVTDLEGTKESRVRGNPEPGLRDRGGPAVMARDGSVTWRRTGWVLPRKVTVPSMAPLPGRRHKVRPLCQEPRLQVTYARWRVP